MIKNFFYISLVFILLMNLESFLNNYSINIYLFLIFSYLYFLNLAFQFPKLMGPVSSFFFGILLDLHTNTFFGLNALMLTFSFLIIQYNYFQLRMFSQFQLCLFFSLLGIFFLGFRLILESTTNFSYLFILTGLFINFISSIIINFLSQLFFKKIGLNAIN